MTRAGTEPAESRLRAAAGLISRPSFVFWAVFVAVCGTATIRTRLLLSQAFYAAGDAGVNSLLVLRAEHLQLLVGNYSRVGVHHPGPAFLYGLASAEVVLDKALHLVPTPYNAQLLGTNAYVAGAIALVAVVLRRTLGSSGAALAGAGVCFVLLAREGLFAQDWFPYLYMPAFLLFMLTGAAVAAGRTAELPVYALTVGLLVHGHVSFVMFTGATTLLVLLGWCRSHRGGVREELARHRRAWVGALAVTGLFALPLLVNTARHFPEPWRGYAHFATSGDREPRSAGEVVGFVARYWTDTELPLSLFALVAAVGALLLATERESSRRRLLACLYSMLALQTLLTTYYVARGVDFLEPRSTYGYVGFFYLTVPALLLVAVSAHLWLRLAEQAAGRGRLRGLASAGGAALLVGLLVLGGTRPALRVDLDSPMMQRSEGFVEAANALSGHPGLGSRRVALVPVDNDGWPAIAGVAIQLAREGVPFCVDETYPVWRNMFTPAYGCRADQAQWRVGVVRNAPRPPAGTVWQGFAGGYATTIYAL